MTLMMTEFHLAILGFGLVLGWLACCFSNRAIIIDLIYTCAVTATDQHFGFHSLSSKTVCTHNITIPLEHAGNNESEHNQGDHDATQAEYLHMYI